MEFGQLVVLGLDSGTRALIQGSFQYVTVPETTMDLSNEQLSGFDSPLLSQVFHLQDWAHS